MGPCLTLDDFERHASGRTDDDARTRFESHIAECQKCESAYKAFVEDNRFLAGVKRTLKPSAAAETVPVSGVAARGQSREWFPRIAGYDIKRVIGRGGMGVVYEAIQEKLGRSVALKLLPALAGSAHPELVTRFQREATAAAKLHHTNIIPVYDFGESRDGYYYAMELIDGPSLATLIKRLAAIDAPRASHTTIVAMLTAPDSVAESEGGTVGISEAPSSGTSSASGSRSRPYYRQIAHWFADVAEALHYAHVRGMVHRDIKPGNLMLCTDGRMVVLDFGLVKNIDDHSVTATGSLVGTYRYMSPEQVGAKRISVDARSDVYSLGATLYECLVFQPAFGATEQSELLSQLLFKEPAPPRKTHSSVPVDLQTICLKAMEKSPSARYQTARAMADDLLLYLRDLPIVARPQGPIGRTIKFVRRRRLETIAVAAVILLAAATGLWWRARGQEQFTHRLDVMKQGVAHWQEEDWAAAQDKFGEVLDDDPRDYPALVSLASMYKDQYYATNDAKLLDQANALLERAVEVCPDRHEAWNVKGVLYQALDRPSDAIAAYEKVLDIDESYYAVWVNLGMLHATARDLAKAEACARRGTELVGEEQTVMPWRVLAAIQLHTGHRDAFETLTKARRIDNTDVATLVLFARYHLGQVGPENVQQALRLAVTADTLLESGELDVQDRAVKSKTVPQAKRTLALVRLRNEEWQLAAEVAQQAIAADDQPTVARLILAVAAGRLGDSAAAREHLKAAEATWPEELKRATFRAAQDGHSLWFDTAEDFERLREQARRTIEHPAGTGPKNSAHHDAASPRPGKLHVARTLGM